MAPYTMKVLVKNNTDNKITWIGSSTLKLDGQTAVDSVNIDPHTEGSAKVTKSGGTDGLFTAVSWVVWEKTEAPGVMKFSVWSAMPASSGGQVSVRFANTTSVDDSALTSKDFAEYCQNNWDFLKLLKTNAATGFNMKLTLDVNPGYPDSNCTVTINKA